MTTSTIVLSDEMKATLIHQATKHLAELFADNISEEISYLFENEVLPVIKDVNGDDSIFDAMSEFLHDSTYEVVVKITD